MTGPALRRAALILGLPWLCVGGPAAKAQGGLPIGQAVVLPSAFYTLVAPRSGQVTKLARTGDVFKPMPPVREAWFLEAPTGDELQAFIQTLEANSVARIVSDDFRQRAAEEDARSDRELSALSRFGQKRSATNTPPWTAADLSDARLARLLRAAWAALLAGGSIPSVGAADIRAYDVPSGTDDLKEFDDDPRIAAVRAIAGADTGTRDIANAIYTVMQWAARVRMFDTSLWGVSPTPYDPPDWEPNNPGLIVNGRIRFVVQRASALALVDRSFPSSLDRFIEYWSWVAGNSVRDEDDSRFLTVLALGCNRPAASGADLDALARDMIAEAVHGRETLRRGKALAVLLGIALPLDLTQVRLVELQLYDHDRAIKFLQDRVVRLSYSFPIPTAPGQIDDDDRKLTVGDVAAAGTELSFVANHAEPEVHYDDVLWVANEVRPPIGRSGNLVEVTEAPGIVQHDPVSGSAGQVPLRIAAAFPTVRVPLPGSSFATSVLLGADGDFGPELQYSPFLPSNRLARIETEQAAALTPLVTSAETSQRVEEIQEVGRSYILYRVRLGADLRRAARSIRDDRTLRLEQSARERIASKYGYFFVAENAVVVSTAARQGQHIDEGSAVLVLRPTLRYDLVLGADAAGVGRHALSPGSRFQVKLACGGGLVPSGVQTRAPDGRTAAALADLKRQLLDARAFDAEVAELIPELDGNTATFKVRLLVALKDGDDRLEVTGLAESDASALETAGMAVTRDGDRWFVTPPAGPLAIGEICRVSRVDDEAQLPSR